jgi:acetate kinase
VPTQWHDEWGVRRYGFHGISVQWCAELLGDRFRRLVVCHLGGGASVSAVLDGRSVDTTMGFSPLEGVPMETRSGSVDPGALLYLLRQRLLTLEELDHALHHDSGLRALSGMSGGMQQIEAAAGHNASARLALDVYAHRVAAAVAAMAASLGGLDAVAFTGGVGEGSSGVRERVCARLAFLGVDLDTATSRAATPDADVATPHSAVRVIVVRSREELVIAREVRTCIGCSTA